MNSYIWLLLTGFSPRGGERGGFGGRGGGDRGGRGGLEEEEDLEEEGDLEEETGVEEEDFEGVEVVEVSKFVLVFSLYMWFWCCMLLLVMFGSYMEIFVLIGMHIFMYTHMHKYVTLDHKTSHMGKFFKLIIIRHLKVFWISGIWGCKKYIHFCQYVCSLGIEPTTFCAANTMFYHWAYQVFSVTWSFRNHSNMLIYFQCFKHLWCFFWEAVILFFSILWLIKS